MPPRLPALTRHRARLAGAGLLLAAACDTGPAPMPTEVAVHPEEAAREAATAETGGEPAASGDGGAATDENGSADEETPPLYQLLYEAPVTGAPDAATQRVRILAWLRHLEMRPDQLDRLDALRRAAAERAARLEAEEAEAQRRIARAEAPVYADLWAAMRRGASPDDPALADLARRLQAARSEADPEALIRRRGEWMRSVLDAEGPFLATLSPEQERRFGTVAFVLRHRLDPVANPGDYRELVGTTYEPGQYAVLSRGVTPADREPLDLGGLWSDDPALDPDALLDARREVLLFLLLLEPGLDEAIAAARDLAADPSRGTGPADAAEAGAGE